MIPLKFSTLVVLCILTHVIRTIYEILKHRRIIRATKVTFIIVFLNMFLLWSTWFTLCPLDPGKIILPEFIHYFGISLVVLGIITFVTGLLTIKSFESYEGDLITHGIYSFVRHPMYLAFIFWLVGMPLFSGGKVSYILAVIFVINVFFWRYLEELELVDRFPEYTNYRKKTLF